jgi:tartrate/fumarate subfamily iron-sulfur-dependent hydro-lyase alpha chain
MKRNYPYFCAVSEGNVHELIHSSMATPAFKYQEPFPVGKDTTSYYLLTKEHVSTTLFEGKPIIKVEPEGLTALAQACFHDVAFFLRTEHQEQVAAILNDPEASKNDKYVALTFLRNAEVSAKGKLPFCQDTGTAVIVAKKGQQIWTGVNDAEALSKGVYETYTTDNLRYSQNVPTDMYREKNTACNLPAQIDIYATEGEEYKFLCIAKGGGSANKTYLFQETKALLNPDTLLPFLVEKMKTLGTAACPPYHIAFVIGGTSAETNLKTVKLASAHYYDHLPTEGNDCGQAFRDIELERQVLEAARKTGLGAQFGGKHFAHDIRIIRLPRHGASCPVGMGVSCSADRNIKAKINKEGIWIEQLETNPGRFIPEALRRAGEGEAVDRPEPADARSIGGIGQVSGSYAPVAQWNDRCRPRYSSCQAQGTPRQRARFAAIRQGSPHLLCRPRQDPAGDALRLLWPHDSRAYGLLCRYLPVARRQSVDDSQGKPQSAGDGCLPQTRRFLPRQYRRPGGHPRSGQHQESGVLGIPRIGDGSDMED